MLLCYSFSLGSGGSLLMQVLVCTFELVGVAVLMALSWKCLKFAHVGVSSQV